MMELPINKSQAQKVSAWLKENYLPQIQNAIMGTPWSFEIVASIACQETAYKWLRWVDHYPADIILARCVFDASGEPEFPKNPRHAFPQNRRVFREHYGDAFLEMLVAEGNKQRAMPQPDSIGGYLPKPFLYKGYGIYQYDLQHVVQDSAFFEKKLWYNMEDCLSRLIKELNTKAQNRAQLREIVKAYNGSGPRAIEYANNVMQFAEWV